MIHALALCLCWFPLPVPPPEPPPEGIQLLDALKFGVSPEAAEALASLASNHPPLLRGAVALNNGRAVVWQWERECEYRAKCWGLLRVALDDEAARSMAWGIVAEEREPTPDEIYRAKLDALAELRGLLGEADYYAGRMPDPTPKYRPWCDR
jgi:hypothetical protein